ncbi:MAG: glycoside hydrolase family 32 protein [Pseudomonadota bacterium]
MKGRICGALAGIACAVPVAGSADLTVSFDQADPFGALNGAEMHSPYFPPHFATGTDGTALRFDGYSTWVTGEMDAQTGPVDIAVDVALASMPPAGTDLVSVGGVTLGLNRWGYVTATVTAQGRETALISPEPLDLHRWARVGVRVGDGLSLWVDGARVRHAALAAPPDTIGGTVEIGRDASAPLMHGVFPTGVLNGLLDRLSIGAAGDGAGAFAAPSASDPDLFIPPSRFAEDPDRPAYHPMPPAGWANEPHALTRIGDRWHLFYQANPSGPWWDHMHWGQLMSDDLVTWTPAPPALTPSPGFDSEGIWVGDLITESNTASAVYTGVNGQWAGVGLATAEATAGPLRLRPAPANPVLPRTPQGYQDMRDPYILRDGDGWLMLIGSGTLARQTPELLTFRSEGLRDWRFTGPLDIGDVDRFGRFWELPKLLNFGEKWALFVTTVKPHTPARTQYWLGRWDGTRFAPEDPKPQLLDLFTTQLAHSFGEMGKGTYAALGVVPAEARTTEERLTAGWIHALGLPRVVTLCDDGVRLCQTPVAELSTLFDASTGPQEIALTQDWQRLGPSDADLSAARITVALPDTDGPLELALRADPDLEERTVLRFFPDTGRVALDFSNASKTATSRRDTLWADIAPGPIELTLFIDNSITTVFTDTGDSFAFRSFPEGRDANHVFVRGAQADGTRVRYDARPFQDTDTPPSQ